MYVELNGNSILELSQKPILSDVELDKVLKSIFNGNETIPEEIYASTRNKLSEAVSTGYGIDYDLKDVEMVLQLKKNVAVFSAFKANHYAAAMRSMLLDEEGKKRSFNDFRKEAQKIDPKYNQLWLEAEYNMAIRQARSAKQWQKFEEQKGVYPNLEYMPSRSATPSDAHKKYYGTILPIDDPFWDTALPSSRWNCKCWVKQTKDETNAPIDLEAPEPLPGIAGNSGKSKMIFDASHAYMQNLSKQEKKQVKKQMNELEEQNYEMILYKIANNAIEIPVTADASDFVQSVEYLIPFVKKYKQNFGLNPHIGEGKKPELNDTKKAIGDLTTWDNAKNIKSYIEGNYKQKYQRQLKGFKSVFVAFDLNGKLTEKNFIEMWATLNGKMKSSSRLEFVLLKNGNKCLKLKRDVDFEKGISIISKELL